MIVILLNAIYINIKYELQQNSEIHSKIAFVFLAAQNTRILNVILTKCIFCFSYCRPNEKEGGSKNNIITDQIAINIVINVCDYLACIICDVIIDHFTDCHCLRISCC